MTTDPKVALLKANLKTLRLPTMLAEWERLAHDAAESGHTFADFLLRLSELEVATRSANALASRIRQADFPTEKDLASFDFTAIASLNKQKVLELARCEWIDQHFNCCLVGNSGTGKTHVSVGLGRSACEAGYRVRFFTAAHLVTALEKARKQYDLDRFLSKLDKVDLLIVDEMGYLSFSRSGAELLFQVFADRYERRSLLISSNLAFSEWEQIFQGERMTACAVGSPDASLSHLRDEWRKLPLPRVDEREAGQAREIAICSSSPPSGGDDAVPRLPTFREIYRPQVVNFLAPRWSTWAEKSDRRPVKTAQTFWILDADTCQPICFTTGTAARSVVTATPELVELAQQILAPAEGQTLLVADSEHFSGELVADIQRRSGFDLLVPMPRQPAHRKRWQAVPEEQFTRRWAGYATAKVPYEMKYRHPGRYWEFIERFDEPPDEWRFQGFLSTTDREEVDALTRDFPDRWHVEEFFNSYQALGWNRAGTMNLNIRYGQMTMALIAQAAIHGLRRRLGEPYSNWDANHLAQDLFFRLEGDVRIQDNTILVTYYNAPEQLRQHYADLPRILAEANIDPHVPWLYGYQLDFRFR